MIAEQVALLDAVNEMMFFIQLLGSMKVSVKLPVMVRVDNVGTIFMASNITTTACTKQIDIRYKYVNEYMEDRLVQIIFGKSTENGSNMLTTNLSAEFHEKQSKKNDG